jgi:hypothetical protein
MCCHTSAESTDPDFRVLQEDILSRTLEIQIKKKKVQNIEEDNVKEYKKKWLDKLMLK